MYGKARLVGVPGVMIPSRLVEQTLKLVTMSGTGFYANAAYQCQFNICI
jgi:hypothetical protein